MRDDGLLAACLAVVMLVLAACATADGPGPGEPGKVSPGGRADIAEKWGVEIVGIRRSAADTILDFRYRILDAEKAIPVVDRRIPALLIDQASGMKLGVPSSPTVGPLRQTTKYGPPKVGRVYFILFTNPGRLVQSGGKVTVVIGDFRVEDLVVE